MAQHLKGIPVSQVIQSIHRSGLRVTSIHDGGGVLNDRNSTAGYINPKLDEYLGFLGYAPEYLVFHPPQVEGNLDTGWWQKISRDIIQALNPYRSLCSFLTFENEPFFNGFSVPHTTPEELHTFVAENELGVTFDTTHYAYMGTNILDAARILTGCIRSIHLSDFLKGQIHVYVGEGELDLAGFFRLINPKVLNTVTLECSVSTVDQSDREMSHAKIVDRLRILKLNVENMPVGNL